MATARSLIRPTVRSVEYEDWRTPDEAIINVTLDRNEAEAVAHALRGRGFTESDATDKNRSMQALGGGLHHTSLIASGARVHKALSEVIGR